MSDSWQIAEVVTDLGSSVTVTTRERKEDGIVVDRWHEFTIATDETYGTKQAMTIRLSEPDLLSLKSQLGPMGSRG